MRFAITTHDRTLPVFETFVKAGWTPVKVFSHPPRTRLFPVTQSLRYADKLKLPIQLSRMEPADLEDLKHRGCEVLVVAGYDWKVPAWESSLKYAVNFHPSPLPEGRGRYPAVRALLEGRDRWGVSCHKISPGFDEGELLGQEHFAIATDETHDSLDIKIQVAQAALAKRVAEDFESLWGAATPQKGGSYWPMFTKEERTLDFNQPVAEIVRRARAFEDLECLAPFDPDNPNALLNVRRVAGWQATHYHLPGTMVLRSATRLVYAAQDGYIALLEWSYLSVDDETGRIGRS